MDMTGERRIAATRQTVWEALNDPAILQASIPGCDKLEKLSDTEMQATAAVKVGPMSGRFSGKVHLADLDPPNGYTISGEGQGGVLGFAKGGAKVHLTDDGRDTLLQYEVNAQVGGKLAQLGARLIDCATILTGLTGRTAEQIFGEVDALKLRSSVTLFMHAGPSEPVFGQVLDQYFGGEPDSATENRI